MDLITTLKHEHEEILVRVNAFKSGKGFSDKKWREDLFSAKELFADHLKKEDSFLYPLLKEAGKNDPAAAAVTEDP